ncbi:hypothetical protein [Nannocystis punicea]|uniref:Secreted protein n=1 Tax=Nannocystis punicea TaxID=2995304 RepID=A0ABY7H4K4_9BACT|nr:hypothetical protein [Nannocystis poenicansa]WAS94213.1 hypothetical protein O0S08_49455 [Nannocystis poenicansa]
MSFWTCLSMCAGGALLAAHRSGGARGLAADRPSGDVDGPEAAAAGGGEVDVRVVGRIVRAGVLRDRSASAGAEDETTRWQR